VDKGGAVRNEGVIIVVIVVVIVIVVIVVIVGWDQLVCLRIVCFG